MTNILYIILPDFQIFILTEIRSICAIRESNIFINCRENIVEGNVERKILRIEEYISLLLKILLIQILKKLNKISLENRKKIV